MVVDLLLRLYKGPFLNPSTGVSSVCCNPLPWIPDDLSFVMRAILDPGRTNKWIPDDSSSCDPPQDEQAALVGGQHAHVLVAVRHSPVASHLTRRKHLKSGRTGGQT